MGAVRHRVRNAAKALLAIALALSVVVPIPGCYASSASGSAIASIAVQEFEVYAGDNGAKYRSWYGWSGWGQWCAVFASWCAEQAGLAEGGYAPKDSAVSGWIAYYQEHPECGTLFDGETHVPAAGDFIIWKQELDDRPCTYNSHIGIVVDYDAEANTVYTVEGNLGGDLGHVMRMSYDANAAVTYYARPASAGSGMAGCSAAMGGATAVPEGMGAAKTYMGWSFVTSVASAQYKLRAQAGESYDADGFAKIGPRYVVACTTTFGDVGDFVDVTLEDGTVIQGIIGDTKNQDDEGCNMWGHENGEVVLEFVVDTSTWYSWNAESGEWVGSHANPGTPSCRPEWSARVATVTNLGSWFDGGDPDAAAMGALGCSSAAPGGTTDMGGIEGDVARRLMSGKLGRTQTAAMLAVLESIQGFSEESWPNIDGQVDGLLVEYGLWSSAERGEFESMSSASEAATFLGMYFAGMPESSTDWESIRTSAEAFAEAL